MKQTSIQWDHPWGSRWTRAVTLTKAAIVPPACFERRLLRRNVAAQTRRRGAGAPWPWTFFFPTIPIHCFFFFWLPSRPFSHLTKHRRAHFLLCRSVLALSTRGELRGKRRPPWGLLSWCARLVTFPSQFSIIHRAPVCHVPVPSVCPKQGPPAERVFYNDNLTSSGSDSPETTC